MAMLPNANMPSLPTNAVGAPSIARQGQRLVHVRHGHRSSTFRPRPRTLETRSRARKGLCSGSRKRTGITFRKSRKLIAEVRKNQNATQVEVAAAMGVSQARVSRIEKAQLEESEVDTLAHTSGP
jgi:Helix-turn-helix domain